MPQMKPINWLLLYLMLNMILIFMNIINYFSININYMKNKSYKYNNNLNLWKW